MNEWQPIETAPQGKKVLTYGSAGANFGFLDNEGNWRTSYQGPLKATPRYWMEIPKPPKLEVPSVLISESRK